MPAHCYVLAVKGEFFLDMNKVSIYIDIFIHQLRGKQFYFIKLPLQW